MVLSIEFLAFSYLGNRWNICGEDLAVKSFSSIDANELRRQAGSRASDTLGTWPYGDRGILSSISHGDGAFSVYIDEQPSDSTATSSYPSSGTAMYADFSYGDFQSSQNLAVGIILESSSSSVTCLK